MNIEKYERSIWLLVIVVAWLLLIVTIILWK
jgi:hypothetical protein